MEVTDDEDARIERNNYFSILEAQFKSITRKIDYRLSKSNINIATIRHGLNLLRRTDERNAISAAIINENHRLILTMISLSISSTTSYRSLMILR